VLLAISLAIASCPQVPGAPAPDREAGRATENVILVTLDGVRWQEIFGGADPALLDKESGGLKDVELVKKLAWRETAAERRELLMPFLWTVVAKQGQLWGNVERGSEAVVTNGLNFSYPGYHELLAGFPDPRVDSNDKKVNPNETLPQWLARREGLRGRVAAFASWDTFAWILPEREGLYVNAGMEPVLVGEPNARQALLNELMADVTPPMDEVRPDALTFHSALEYLKAQKPRFFYLSLDETDDFAHQRRYDRVLQTLQTTDRWLRTLWETAQSIPQYRGKTTLLVSTDHGRGSTPADWPDHGKDTPGADHIWLAVLGPDTPPLGELAGSEKIAQNQIAATVAALLGEDYGAAVPRAGLPLTAVLAHTRPGK
jgi:type I phosphodiesterase/nucleotide pyrophosphatase